MQSWTQTSYFSVISWNKFVSKDNNGPITTDVPDNYQLEKEDSLSGIKTNKPADYEPVPLQPAGVFLASRYDGMQFPR